MDTSSLPLADALRRTASLLSKSYAEWDVDWVTEIDSTSTEARRRVEANGARHPFVVMAAHQTAGRGRGLKQWVEPRGKALLFTVAMPLGRPAHVRPATPPPVLTLYPLHLAVAIALRMRLTGWDAELKWPNDVLIEGRKVCGILCEVVSGWILAGVGINLLQGSEDFAEVMPGNAPPVSLLEGRRIPIEGIDPLAAVPTLVQSVVSTLESPWPDERMLDIYRRWCHTLGTRVIAEVGGASCAGIACGVRRDGSLVVDTGGGHEIAVQQEVRCE